METGWRKFNSTIDREPYYYNIFTGAQSWEKVVDIDDMEDWGKAKILFKINKLK